MGMYTGLRLKGIVKEEYRDVINSLINDEYVNCWEDILNKYDKMSFAKEFIDLPRSSGVPFGGLVYMPDEWEELVNPELGKKWDNYKHAKGWERDFNKETGYWQFQCSLKNYDDEIKTFLNIVANVIMESVDHVEVHYEEDRYGHIFELVDGNFIENEDRVIDYEPWNSDNEHGRDINFQ